jgi:hypothetical protein
MPRDQECEQKENLDQKAGLASFLELGKLPMPIGDLVLDARHHQYADSGMRVVNCELDPVATVVAPGVHDIELSLEQGVVLVGTVGRVIAEIIPDIGDGEIDEFIKPPLRVRRKRKVIQEGLVFIVNLKVEGQRVPPVISCRFPPTTS